MSGGQNYLLLAMDMAKVGGPWWSTIRCEGFHTTLNIPSPLPTTLVSSYFRRLLISCVDIPFFLPQLQHLSSFRTFCRNVFLLKTTWKQPSHRVAATLQGGIAFHLLPRIQWLDHWQFRLVQPGGLSSRVFQHLWNNDG